MRTWERRQHTKRASYAPRHGLLGMGHRKHGEPTIRDCWRLSLDDSFALRDFADDQGVCLSDAIVMALTVGGAGLAEPDARIHAGAYLEELQRRRHRVEQELARDRLARVEANERFRLQLQRDIALRTWQRRLLKRVSAQDRHDHQVLVDDAKKQLLAFVAADVVKADVAANIDVNAKELLKPEATIQIGERIPLSMQRAIKEEACRCDVTATAVVAIRVQRFLQLHGRDPVVRQLVVAIQEERREIARLIKRRRAMKRATKILQRRRHQIRDRLQFILQRRGQADRVSTPGERAAIDAQLRDPRCLEAIAVDAPAAARVVLA